MFGLTGWITHYINNYVMHINTNHAVPSLPGNSNADLIITAATNTTTPMTIGTWYPAVCDKPVLYLSSCQFYDYFVRSGIMKGMNWAPWQTHPKDLTKWT